MTWLRKKEEAQPYLQGLSGAKLDCILILIEWSDKFKVDTEGKTVWEFYFDDGAFKGGWTFKIKQKAITIWKVLEVAKTVNWPGLRFLEAEAETAMLQAIKLRLT